MHIVKNQKSRYGHFDLIPAEGYTLLTAFTDLESGLLIAGEVKTEQREENPAQRPTGNLPIRYTIIDPGTGRMLTRSDLDTGAIVSRSESVAFRTAPLPTLFESYLADKEAQQHKAVEHGKYPPELYAQDLAGLKDGLLMHYRSRSENFELLREDGRYYLYYQIYQWENKVYSKENQDVYTQFCVRCGAGVMYSPRYPRRICRDCCQLLTDRNGAPLVWLAVELGMRKSADGRVKVYIGEVVYWAQEARFGGIAVQQ